MSGHFDAFLEAYEERSQPRYGFPRPIILEVVNKFLDCGDLERGFACVRCDHCKHEYLLAFSCIRLRPAGYAETRGSLVLSILPPACAEAASAGRPEIQK